MNPNAFQTTSLFCWLWQQKIEIGNAEDEDLAGGAKLYTELIFVANVEGEMMPDIRIFSLGAGTEAAVELAAKQRVDSTAGVRGELLRRIADDAGVHLVFEEAAPQAVFGSEHGARF